MRKALTAKTIDALKPGPRRYDVHDILCPGLSVRVGKQGHKTFTVKYRYGLKQRRLRLGVHPRTSLVHAREKALEALRQVDEGIDPAARRRQLSTRVEAVCEDFIRQYAKPRNSSWREAERIAELVEHNEIKPRELRCQGPGLADPGFFLEPVHIPAVRCYFSRRLATSGLLRFTRI